MCLLTDSLRAVKIEAAGSTTISVLPIVAHVDIAGPSKLPGFIEVICGADKYCVFPEDLTRKTILGPLSKTAST